MVGTDVILAFPCFFTQIYLEAKVSKLLDMDQFIEPNNTTDLGLIKDATNPMSRWLNKEKHW